MRENDSAGRLSLRKIAIPAFGPSLLFGLGEGAILPVVALSSRGLGASVAAAALIVTLLGIGSLLSNVPASLLTAKYGERPAIIVAATMSMFAMVCCGLAPNIWVFAVGIFLIGAASAVFNLARQSYLTEAVPVQFRARALSTLGGVMRVGVFAGPFAGALAIQLMGLSGAYWVGAAAVVAAGAVAWTLPDLVHPYSSRSAAPAPPPSVRSLLVSHRRVFLTVGLGVLLVSAVRASRQAVIPLWAENLGLDAATTSLIYGLSGAIDMLVFYPAGMVMDRNGRTWVAVPSMLLMGLALILMPLSTGAGTLLLVSLLIGFGNGIGSGMVMTLGADYSPSCGRAQFLGIWRFLSDVGSSGGPALLSGLTAVATLSIGISATGVLGLAAAAALWYWIPRNAPDRGAAVLRGPSEQRRTTQTTRRSGRGPGLRR
ncbi:MFS transporter [Paenarthrobacter sp. PH39-S1]|uniref:MFS transporter n=1 Tax=Paenarthrobacter sp. PH39-S1 TaxID=3046204 RepID=UPI0024BB6218|nr:MFS transporter [Paenarthrobacter sp. PH39-S1]MDJ0355086.1 MFS transporter [Paenarthrobacter sp. PH39-S1]